MARIAIVADHDTALGFKLTGIDVFTVSSYQEAEGYIQRFLKNREYEIVGYSGEISGDLSESLQKKMEESVLPVFISIPSVQSCRGVEKGEEYLAKVLQRTLGFYVKIKR